jgi:gamma-glutamyl hercynylcysteine S-oxide synthase
VRRIAPLVEFHYASKVDTNTQYRPAPGELVEPRAQPLVFRQAQDERSALIAWYRRNRERSRVLFDLLDDESYYTKPISLRHPIVFYEGHLPAFSFNTLVKRALGGASIDPRLESLFARGIDPSDESAAAARPELQWPSREAVRDFGSQADRQVLDALAHADLERPGDPLLDRAEAVFTILEHEAMHQETLLYMWHRLPYEQKRRPASGEGREQRGAESEGRGASRGNAAARGELPTSVVISSGIARLGASRETAAFGWDNEFEAHEVHVPAFDIDVLPVTNGQYLEFIEAGGYQDRHFWDDEGWSWIQAEQVQHPAFWLPDDPAPRLSSLAPRPSPLAHRQWQWRGMFEEIPLPGDWPVYVSQAEASAYARWKGRRLMTEPEFHRAAHGNPSGDERDGSAAPQGHFDFASFEPVPVGSFPPSAWGVHDLIGNGWEWTSTIFGPFAGFTPMASYPEYSADFFDGQHYVMKGASPATARELVRPSFRNWFRGNYPYVYAKFRTVA